MKWKFNLTFISYSSVTHFAWHPSTPTRATTAAQQNISTPCQHSLAHRLLLVSSQRLLAVTVCPVSHAACLYLINFIQHRVSEPVDDVPHQGFGKVFNKARFTEHWLSHGGHKLIIIWCEMCAYLPFVLCKICAAILFAFSSGRCRSRWG